MKVLRGGWFSGGRGEPRLRRGLVVFQFTLTVFLVIGTLVVDKQLRYIRSKNLGIDTSQVLTTHNFASGLKEAILADPGVMGVSQSQPPGQELRAVSDISWEGKNPEDQIQFFPAYVDAEYLETFRLRMSEGRYFSETMATDRSDAVILNETAARAMGSAAPIGKTMKVRMMSSQGTMEERTYSVIGVMKDFHQTSLHRPIEPIFFIFQGDQWPWLNIRIHPANIGGTLEVFGEDVEVSRSESPLHL